MRFFYYFLSISLLSTIVLVACAKDSVNFDPNALTLANCTDSISFINQVKPIIEQNCSTSGCHDVSASGGYEFLTYPQISENADIIYRSMNHENGVNPMPEGAEKLSESQIKIVGCWKLQGKLNN